MSNDNIEKLAAALGFDPDNLSAGKRAKLESLSPEEVQKVIEIGDKIRHEDDDDGPGGPYPF